MARVNLILRNIIESASTNQILFSDLQLHLILTGQSCYEHRSDRFKPWAAILLRRKPAVKNETLAVHEHAITKTAKRASTKSHCTTTASSEVDDQTP